MKRVLIIAWAGFASLAAGCDRTHIADDFGTSTRRM